MTYYPDHTRIAQTLLDKQGEINDLRATVAELHGLIRDLADPDPCWFDHHGYCQAHGWMDTEPPCADGRAQKLLAALDGDTPKETT